jgi:glycosyltransferase involved in cell wall biosynthesis
MRPLVSVVVPTVNRSHLVLRAVRSALAQDLAGLEVIVVVDGPDAATSGVLAGVDDPRLRVVELGANGGLGKARNEGIAAARGDWVALLDDDDEWLQGKLGIQLAAATRSPYRLPIVACRFTARTARGDVILPRRVPEPDEALSEYLFCQRGLLGGEGLVLPSTVLVAEELARRVPFRFARLPNEGSDWLLRAIEVDGAGVEFVPAAEPLAIWHGEPAPGRMSEMTDWRASLGWAEANGHRLTPRAHAGFILIRVSLQARRARSPAAFWQLPLEAFRRGRPTAACLAAHSLIWLVPAGARYRIAAMLGRLSRAGGR